MGQSAVLTHETEAQAEQAVIPGMGAIHVRPLTPADWPAYCAFGGRLERNDLRLRFAGPVKLDDDRFRRYLDIDHDHEEAFGAFDAEGEMLGVGRLVRIASDEAEIALIVRSDLKRRGLGSLLLERLARFADGAGIAALRADVLYENLPMVYLAQRVGFRFVGDGGLMIAMRKDLMRKDLGPRAGALASGAAVPQITNR